MGSETAFLWARDDDSVSRDGVQDVGDVAPELPDDVEELGSRN